MATVIFNGNPQAEAVALVALLTLWLKEQPEQPDPKAVSAQFVHDTSGLARVVVTLEKDGE